MQMISDEELEVLGESFDEMNLHSKGWEFHEFVSEYQQGTIAFYSIAFTSKRVNVFTRLMKKMRGFIK